jgi:hypothetical protein
MGEGYSVRCAAASRERTESLVGTASRVQRWMLVEQPGSWGVDALRESRLDRAVADRLADEAATHGVRVLLVRRPGQLSLGEARKVFLAHSGVESWWIEQLDVDTDADLVEIDLGALAFPDPPTLGAPGPDALHLVCTNGRHDPCCADHGRPVVRALAAAAAPDVWECSHVGGDRFAANVVSLPRGIYYGRVPPDGAARIVADDRDGLVDLDCYRGRSCYPPLVQAAEWFARSRLGDRRADGIGVLSLEPVGDGEWIVHLQQRGGPAVTAHVHRGRTDSVEQLTCRSDQMQAPWRFTLRQLQVHRAV